MYSEINHRKMGKQREMEKANIEAKTYDEFLRDADRKCEKLQNESTNFEEQVAKIEQYRTEMAQNSDTLTDLNPKCEELKQQLDQKQAQIMEVGGQEYRRLKEELDQATN